MQTICWQHHSPAARDRIARYVPLVGLRGSALLDPYTEGAV